MLEVRGRVSEEEDHGGRFKEGRSGKEGQVRRVRGCVLTLLGIETDEVLGRRVKGRGTEDGTQGYRVREGGSGKEDQGRRISEGGSGKDNQGGFEVDIYMWRFVGRGLGDAFLLSWT